MTVINPSQKVLSIYEKPWQFHLWQFPARIDPPPSGLVDQRWKISQEVISRISSPSFSSSHNTMALAINREEYDNGAELENRRFAL